MLFTVAVALPVDAHCVNVKVKLPFHVNVYMLLHELLVMVAPPNQVSVATTSPLVAHVVLYVTVAESAAVVPV